MIGRPSRAPYCLRSSSLSIDAVIVDPFVSCHRVPENDNGGMDVVAKAWARIARDANCAVELVHHVQEAVEWAIRVRRQ